MARTFLLTWNPDKGGEPPRTGKLVYGLATRRPLTRVTAYFSVASVWNLAFVPPVVSYRSGPGILSAKMSTGIRNAAAKKPAM